MKNLILFCVVSTLIVALLAYLSMCFITLKYDPFLEWDIEYRMAFVMIMLTWLFCAPVIYKIFEE